MLSQTVHSQPYSPSVEETKPPSSTIEFPPSIDRIQLVYSGLISYIKGDTSIIQFLENFLVLAILSLERIDNPFKTGCFNTICRSRSTSPSTNFETIATWNRRHDGCNPRRSNTRIQPI